MEQDVRDLDFSHAEDRPDEVAKPRPAFEAETIRARFRHPPANRRARRTRPAKGRDAIEIRTETRSASAPQNAGRTETRRRETAIHSGDFQQRGNSRRGNPGRIYGTQDFERYN